MSRCDFEGVFSWEQVKEREARDDFGAHRRAMLATLIRSSQQLIEGFREDIESGDGKTLFELVESIESYKKHLKVLIELSDCAEARLLFTAQAFMEESED